MAAAKRQRLFSPMNPTRARGCSRIPRSSVLMASYRIPILGFLRSFLSSQGNGLRRIEGRLEHKVASRRGCTTAINLLDSGGETGGSAAYQHHIGLPRSTVDGPFDESSEQCR